MKESKSWIFHVLFITSFHEFSILNSKFSQFLSAVLKFEAKQTNMKQNDW